MKLLTKENLKALQPLYSGESNPNIKAVVKFFTPDADWTWYASEFDGEDTFFGLTIGHEAELGYFSLSELQKIRGGLGLPIKRDRYFDPMPLKELMEKHQ